MTCGDCGAPTETMTGFERLSYGPVPAKVTVCTKRDGPFGCQWRRVVPNEGAFSWPHQEPIRPSQTANDSEESP
jgi:hypothetical protein